MPAEKELKQIEPDRLRLVKEEPPARMLGEVPLLQHARTERVEPRLACPPRVGEPELLAQSSVEQTRSGAERSPAPQVHPSQDVLQRAEGPIHAPVRRQVAAVVGDIV